MRAAVVNSNDIKFNVSQVVGPEGALSPSLTAAMYLYYIAINYRVQYDHIHEWGTEFQAT